jgi:glycosyltransferase XagB
MSSPVPMPGQGVLRRIIGRDLTRHLVLLDALPHKQGHGDPVLLAPSGLKALPNPNRPGLLGQRREVERADFWRAQEELFGPDAISEAVWGLKTRQPEDSAFWVVTTPQKKTLLIAAAAMAALVALAPGPALAALVFALTGLNLVIALFRLTLAWCAPEPTQKDEASPAPLTVAPHELPFYTIMIPMYREAAVVPGLVRSIGGLDYPADRIEIFLVCEEDDAETLSAARRASAGDARFRTIAVPACEPRTKPKALNYALCFARGELLVIYDAEDRPDPDQLRKAAQAFSDGPPELACVQARLNWYNRNHNWLTRAFALEYALWFDYMLPGLQRIGAPIPLGGTSNHFNGIR